MLTPKVKKDFDKYLEILSEKIHDPDADIYLDEIFNNLPTSAQFGIYQDYFAEENINIEAKRSIVYYTSSQRVDYEALIDGDVFDWSKSIDQARKTAITEASELLESRL